jgi:multicomponent Na+:H+ antiporter subunit D
MVIALTITAALTLGFFLFNGPVLELERQIFGGSS